MQKELRRFRKVLDWFKNDRERQKKCLATKKSEQCRRKNLKLHL